MNNDTSPSVVPEAAEVGAAGHAAGSGEGPAALWNRNFGLLWQGQLISSIGKQAFALTCMLWLKELTGSGTLMGLLMTFGMLPAVILGPVAGVVVDRVDRRKLIAWTDIAGGVLVVSVLAAILLSGVNTTVAIVGLFIVATATGLLDAFSQPAIGASVPTLVPKESLDAANGLNMGSVQIAVFLSQAGSGILYRLLGAPLLVLLNGITYLYAGISELFMRIPAPPPGKHAAAHPWHRFRLELAEGFSFVLGHRGMRTMLLVFTVLNFFVAPILVILPFFVQDYVGMGAEWYGYVMASFGAGMLAGFTAMGAASPKGKARAATLAISIVVQSALIPVMLIPMHSLGVLALMFFIGFTGGLQSVAFVSLLQAASPAHLLGRVQSLSMTIAAGIMPLGMGVGGFVFDLTGKNVPLVLGICGGLTLFVSIVSLFNRDYVRFMAWEPRQ